MMEPRTRRRLGPRTGQSRFIVVTGLSGAGKSQAIHAIEDLGYFCVDNLPTSLVPTLAALAMPEPLVANKTHNAERIICKLL